MTRVVPLAILLASVALAAARPAPVAAQPPRACEPMVVEGFTAPATAPAPPRGVAPELVALSVPVVVHYMNIAGSDGEVARRFPPDKLIQYFRESGVVNRIWYQAGMLLYLQRFEACSFRFADFGLDAGPSQEIDSPARSEAGRERFRRINEAYNAPDIRGVDLYVWGGIMQDGGYGDRWLETGALRAGAAWIDPDCFDNRNVDCDLLLAHEIGHFLGLCHSCVVGQAQPGIRCTRCLPDSMKQPDGSYTLEKCREVPKRIMRSDNLKLFLPYTVNGTELSRCERRLANAFAHRRVALTTKPEGGASWVAAQWESCRDTRSTW
jgi:hypothetical protein